MSEVPIRSVLRIVLIVVLVAISLYLVYLVRKPLGWLLISIFLAVALSPPVNALQRYMKRGLAITIVYLCLLLIPLGLMALIVPPLITEANDFAQNVPQYARDISDYVQDNERLRKLNHDYKLTEKLQQEAEKLPTKLGGAAKTLRDVGFGIVSSAFALITILVLTAFLLSNGRRWTDAALAIRRPDQAARLRRSLDNMGAAVGGYVAGALVIAVIAGVQTYIVLTILGVPFRAPLAVIAGLFSLIPLVGATIAAVLIGAVTVFDDFPTVTIIWAVWAIVYQQFENHVIQPQVQRRTVHVQPMVTIVAVLFGATLLGVLGALVAIPVAASIQILMREYWDWRTMSVKLDDGPPPPDLPPSNGPADDEPPPAGPASDPLPA